MNIIFFHSNGILPTFGGISRVTHTLGVLFASKGNRVWYVGAQDKHIGQSYDCNQWFLPSPTLFAKENIHCLANFIKENQVDVVVNQNALNPRYAEFLAVCKKQASFLLVSCFHNSILTPILNGAYQKEYLLKKKKLGYLFTLMRTRFISTIMTRTYIVKYRKRYLSTINNSDRVFVLCNGQVSELYRMCGISFSDKVRIVPNGIEINTNQLVPKEKIVLWLGTFDYSIKRPDNMLRIWKMVENENSDWKLYMLGDGPSLEEMKEMANKMNLKNVCFKGRVNPDDYYKRAAICCVTSVHESFSMVVLESQRAACVPIVNNSFTSVPMLIQNGVTGFTVSAFDNKSFAETLSSLMQDGDTLQKVGLQALENVNRFSLDNIYNKWIQQLK